MAGLERASGGLIVTLPAYHQIDGRDVAKLLAPLDSADVAIGWRWPRSGGALERMRRAMFHGMVAGVTGMRLHDLGCGARAMKRRVLEELSLYGDQHRLLAVLADRQGFRVTEVELRQSERDRFEGVYRPREYAHLVLDVFTVFFLVRFTKKPLRFFGMIGASMCGLGVLVVLYLVFDSLVFNQSLADRPALLLSSLLVGLGPAALCARIAGGAHHFHSRPPCEGLPGRGDHPIPRGRSAAGSARGPRRDGCAALITHSGDDPPRRDG
jgi:hypothetical protein